MNEMSKNLVCILLREQIEIWVEKERAEKLEQMLKQINCPQFIEYNGQLINKADIAGVFDAETMDERTRRKNGQWKCKFGTWHDRGEKCFGRECFLNNHEEYNKLQKSIGDDYFIDKGSSKVFNEKYRETINRLEEIKKESYQYPSKKDGTIYDDKI